MKLISFLFAGLLCFFFFSCEKDIELDFPKQGKLVLLSNFNPDSLFRVHLTTSRPIGESSNPRTEFPSNASIRLLEDGADLGDFIFEESDDPDYLASYYYLNKKPEAGKTYAIQVDVPNYPSIKSEASTPAITFPFERLNATSVSSRASVNFPEFLDYTVKTKLQPSAPINSSAYFHLKAWQNKTYFFIDNQDTIEYSFPFEVEFSLPNSIQHLRILHEQGILIDQEAFRDNPDGIEISFFFDFDSAFELKTPIYLELRNVSEDYYLFHKSVGEQEYSSLRESVLATQSILIHNNIEGGLGNFSGYQVTLDSIRW